MRPRLLPGLSPNFYQLRVEPRAALVPVVARDGSKRIVRACGQYSLPLHPVPMSTGVLLPRLERSRKWF